MFDASKKRKRGEQPMDNDWDLQSEAGEPIDLEGEEEEESGEEDEDEGVDNLEGWIDERGNMTQSDKAETAVAVEPVRHVLTKVSNREFIVVHCLFKLSPLTRFDKSPSRSRTPPPFFCPPGTLRSQIFLSGLG
jgi:hypothetical protein